MQYACTADAIRDEDYATPAGFRHELRRFLRFSQEAAAGLMPQQNQALLSIRAAPGVTLSIGALADDLLVKRHSTSELVDRLEALAPSVASGDGHDRRLVTVMLTPRAGRCSPRFPPRIAPNCAAPGRC